MEEVCRKLAWDGGAKALKSHTGDALKLGTFDMSAGMSYTEVWWEGAM